MMRSLLLFLLLLAGACSNNASKASAPAQPLRSLNSGLGTLISVEPVRVEEGFQVWRQGTQRTVQDGLLIHLDGLNASDFLAQAGNPPMFVLGDTIGVTLAQPLVDGKAILLMHSPPADTEVPLWLTSSDVLPHRLQGTSLVSAQQSALAATATSGLNIQTPPASVPRTVYASLPALRLTVLNLKMPREVCALVGKECGVAPGTQFGMIDCGACDAGKVCTSANQCCTPSTCEAQGRSCGTASDSCGNTLECGTCASGQLCTGAGACCTPKTCAGEGRTCGTLSDGCGNTLECGTCAAGQVCTGAGACCAPKTCASLGKNCGYVSDGCGTMLNCGTCPSGQLCGAGGTANVCGECTKIPQSTACANRECGYAADGCGGSYSCGTCPTGQECAMPSQVCGVPGTCENGGIWICNDLFCRCESSAESM